MWGHLWTSPDPDDDSHVPRQHIREESREESQTLWHARQRPEEAEVTLDIATMTPAPACEAQGSWTATTRHGQSIIRQHPLPFSSRPNRLTPSKGDTTIDTAQLQALIDRGATLADIHAACERQKEQDAIAPSWLRAITSRLSLVIHHHTLWGCTGLTWDPQYPRFVSPHPDDVRLGGTPLEEALATVGDGSVILLDAFSAAQQATILAALGSTPDRNFTVIC